MDTVVCLDTSLSMGEDGEKRLKELKNAMTVFFNNANKLNLGERIALVEFGNHTQLLASLTTDYRMLNNITQSLKAGGSTPMAKALELALREIADNGRILTLSEIVSIGPRIILMTDGGVEAEDEAVVFRIVKQIGEAIPVACVGVTGCDRNLLNKIAKISGGMFTMCTDLSELSVFFLEQILISLFIIEFCKEVQQIFDREVLRQFMREHGRNCTDEELDQLLIMIKSMAKQKKEERQHSQRTGAHPASNRIQNNTNSTTTANRSVPTNNRQLTAPVSTNRPAPRPTASPATQSLQRDCSNKIDEATNILRQLRTDVNGAETSYQIQQAVSRNINNVIRILNDLQSHSSNESQKSRTIDLDDDGPTPSNRSVSSSSNRSVNSVKSNSGKITELDDDDRVEDPLESRGSRTTNSKKSLDLKDDDTPKQAPPAYSVKAPTSNQKPADSAKSKVVDLDDDDEPVKPAKVEPKSVPVKAEPKVESKRVESKPKPPPEVKQSPKQEAAPKPAPM